MTGTEPRQPPPEQVDYAKIERSLAELWRSEKESSDGAVTRAALWNVVAHTATPSDQNFAHTTLAAVSEAVPQRSVVVCSDSEAEEGMTSWISANCHLVSGTQQFCSEEVIIVAGGSRVHHVAPLVAALLLPDMPVAVWWLGELPGDRSAYVLPLLEAADRLIVDSSQFDSADDLALLARIAERTTTAPADLNWVRLEDWRAATAAIFDPEAMRSRLRSLVTVRVKTGGEGTFGDAAEALLFVSWLRVQSGQEISCQVTHGSTERGLESIEIVAEDGTRVMLRRDRERQAVIASVEGDALPHTITRLQARELSDLIVRQLKRPEVDAVYTRTLREAHRLAALGALTGASR